MAPERRPFCTDYTYHTFFFNFFVTESVLFSRAKFSTQFQVQNTMKCNLTPNIAVGFNIESVTVENVKIQVWDLGGQTAIRPYWRCYYAKTDGIVFVIDSHDRERLSNVGFEFKNMIQVLSCLLCIRNPDI